MRGWVGGKQYVIARGSQILPSADLFRPPIAPIYVLLASEEASLISGPANKLVLRQQDVPCLRCLRR
jgi:hypothetical protein